MDISRFKQNGISSNDWDQSRYPTPGIGGVPNPGSWSSATPFTRYLFDTPDGDDFGGLCDGGFCNITANGTTSRRVQQFPERIPRVHGGRPLQLRAVQPAADAVRSHRHLRAGHVQASPIT